MQPPDPIHPDQLRDDTEYIVMIRPNTGQLSFVGPFRPTSSILPIVGDYPFTGNFRVKGFFSEEEKVSHVLIPKDGSAIIFRMEFTLHLYTPDLKELMQITLRGRGDWMRAARSCDYYD